MRAIFATTKSVEQFLALARALESRDVGVPGLGLVFGEPGLGKTQTAIWYAARSGAALVRAKAVMTPRWLLAEIVEELGESAEHYTAKLYQQAKDILHSRKRLIIIDEVDHLASDRRLIETVRDLHDETANPILLIGMSDAERKIARYRHLYDRLRAHVIRLVPLDEEDVAGVARQLCEVELSDCAVAHIATETAGNLRAVIINLYRCERIARTNGLKTVEARHLNGRPPAAKRPARVAGKEAAA